MSQELQSFVIAMAIEPHGHWGRGSTPGEAFAAMHACCSCVKRARTNFFRAYAPEGKVPYVTQLGAIHSWAPPEEIEDDA